MAESVNNESHSARKGKDLESGGHSTLGTDRTLDILHSH